MTEIMATARLKPGDVVRVRPRHYIREYWWGAVGVVVDSPTMMDAVAVRFLAPTPPQAEFLQGRWTPFNHYNLEKLEDGIYPVTPAGDSLWINP